MEYPLFIQGQKAGTVSLARDGLYTRIKAHAPGLGEGLYRISLCGNGEIRYLGLLEPGAEGMYLERRLTKSELAKLPGIIEYASDGYSLHNNNDDTKPTVNKTEIKENYLHNTNNIAAVQQYSPVGGGEMQSPVWRRCGDGSLVSILEGGALLALPVELKRPAPGTRIERIEGKEYMVFRY